MTSSLLISYNQIFTLAKAITFSGTLWDTFSLPPINYFAGQRWCYGGMTSTSASMQIDIDLGTGVTQSLDHMIIAGISKISADATGTDLYIKGSSDNSSFSSIIGTNNLPGCTLLGDSPDILIKSGLNLTVGSVPTTAYRWVRIIGENPSVNIRWIFSKLYAGTFFDMGIDPDDYKVSTVTAAPHGFKFPTGNIGFSKLEYPRSQFEIVWKNITDAKVETFFTNIARNPLANFVFLHTTSQHAVLANKQLVHCQLVDASTTNLYYNRNEVRATFLEARG